MIRYFLFFVAIISNIPFAHSLFHDANLLAPTVGRATGIPDHDPSLTKRVIDAYRLALHVDSDRGHSMWKIIFHNHMKHIHKIYTKKDLKSINLIMQNPAVTNMFYGIDNITSIDIAALSEPANAHGFATLCLDRLLCVAEAMGAIRLLNPEPSATTPRQWNAEEIVHRIETTLGITLSFPNPYPGEVGVATPRGIAADRSIQALYQAWRLKQLIRNKKNPRVLEIGAGMGRTAFYAHLLGIKDYTIIDIPFTSTCAGYYLGRTLGQDQILLLGETHPHPEQRVKVLSPNTFLGSNEHYDLILNADSLTEMDPAIAKAYLDQIAKSADIFVSINHEANSFTAYETIQSSSRPHTVTRYPYWIRKGYVEEVVHFE